MRADKIRQASDLYQRFSGNLPEELLETTVEHFDVGMIVGECAGIMYDTNREGEEEKYIHRFRKSSRPLLVASSDGKSLGIVGGRFRFTERGITDV